MKDQLSELKKNISIDLTSICVKLQDEQKNLLHSNQKPEEIAEQIRRIGLMIREIANTKEEIHRF